MAINKKTKNPDWMSPSDIAEEMGVSKMTVYRMIKSQEITHTLFGNQYLIDRSYFYDEFIPSHTVQAKNNG